VIDLKPFLDDSIAGQPAQRQDQRFAHKMPGHALVAVALP
jgi:hypothetical protein